MGGDIVLKLDSVKLTIGEIQLVAREEFKGKAHTIRMAIGMAATAAFYPPAAPVFLLTRGRDSTVLRGTEVTAFTESDSLLKAADLPMARENASELSEMINLLARGGWLIVEKSKPQIIWHLLCQRKHYTKLPMNKLYVFGRAQDYSGIRCQYRDSMWRSGITRASGKRIASRTVRRLWVAGATYDVSMKCDA